MSRKYSSWASNQPSINPDLSRMRLATVVGNEQDQLKNMDKVEASPHMYINVDIPPPTMTRFDPRGMQPVMIPRQNSSYFAAPTGIHPPINAQTKLWPSDKPLKNSSVFESGSSTSKRAHKHKHHHHHHHHHGNKHHHHHHNHRHRAKSAGSILNRQHQTLRSSSRVMIANPQYIEQDQQQQQQQPMIVYREVPNGEGYTVDANGLASVPYGAENETMLADDQQAPMIVYRDANQQHQSIGNDGMSQQVFFNQDQEAKTGKQSTPLQPIKRKLISHRVTPVTERQVGNYPSCSCIRTPALINPNISVNNGCIQEIERIYIEDDCCLPSSTINCCASDSCFIQQTDPFTYFPQQQSSQIVYCNDPVHQDCLCTGNNNNFIQQSISPQQQFVCLDNTPTTIQPTIINQIPVFNPLPTNTTCQPMVNVSQAPLQRTTSVVIQQPQAQFQPLQIMQQPQQLQVIQQPQPLQVIQQPQSLQVIQQPQQLQLFQQPQQLQFIQNPQTQPGQLVQFASATPQVIQTVQPQVLQTIQMPTQAVAANPQILYQRPYDPVMVPIQNQQVAIAHQPLLALSQPSYAPPRIIPTATGIQAPGSNMFRHALLRTVADRTGVPVLPAAPMGGGAIQLMQPTVAAPMLSNQNFVLAGGPQQSGSLPIIPLTPGGLLIPFQQGQSPGFRPGVLPGIGGYPSNIRNFNDIRQQIQQRRAMLEQAFNQQNYSRVPSAPVLSTGIRNPATPYASGNIFPSGGGTPARTAFPPLTPASYTRAPSTGLNYAQPSYAGSSIGSVQSSPYRPFG